MIRVNLMAADRPTKKKKTASASAPGAVQAYLLLAVFAGGALLLCAGAYLWMTGVLRDLDAQIAKAEQRQRELQAIKKKVDELELKRATAKRKVELIERLQAEQQGPVHMLDEISKALPDFVWLAQMDQTGNTIKFNGQSNSLTSVADFITALQGAGDQCGKPNPLDRTRCWFPDVNLVSSTENNNIITFALSATFSNPEIAAKAAAAAKSQPIPGSTAATAAGTPPR
jgi:type IV pilus assembly protein PilN